MYPILSALICLHAYSVGQAFESRCDITRTECEGQHYLACQSRLPAGECVEQNVTIYACERAGCGYIQDLDHSVGEAKVFLAEFVRGVSSHVVPHCSLIDGCMCGDQSSVNLLNDLFNFFGATTNPHVFQPWSQSRRAEAKQKPNSRWRKVDISSYSIAKVLHIPRDCRVYPS